jgi:hypothetical protein
LRVTKNKKRNFFSLFCSIENPLSEDSQEKPKLLLQKLANKGDAVQDSTQKAVDNIRFLVINCNCSSNIFYFFIFDLFNF